MFSLFKAHEPRGPIALSQYAEWWPVGVVHWIPAFAGMTVLEFVESLCRLAEDRGLAGAVADDGEGGFAPAVIGAVELEHRPVGAPHQALGAEDLDDMFGIGL